ncbi:MAG: hypothetical protein PHN72_05665 [Bacilli bacterium]|nr:hypothetical protein [Bacilli bacterium]
MKKQLLDKIHKKTLFLKENFHHKFEIFMEKSSTFLLATIIASKILSLLLPVTSLSFLILPVWMLGGTITGAIIYEGLSVTLKLIPLSKDSQQRKLKLEVENIKYCISKQKTINQLKNVQIKINDSNEEINQLINVTTIKQFDVTEKNITSMTPEALETEKIQHLKNEMNVAQFKLQDNLQKLNAPNINEEIEPYPIYEKKTETALCMLQMEINNMRIEMLIAKEKERVRMERAKEKEGKKEKVKQKIMKK